jgi:two-component system response regulator
MFMDDQLKFTEILLVEDNQYDVEMVLHTFKKQNITNRIHVVRDGAEALDFIFGTGKFSGLKFLGQPKLILLDLKLPKVDGIEVLRRIRGDPATRLIPVVVLTSSKENRDIEQCYALGVNSYIVKPVDFEQFSNAVREIGLYWMLFNQPPVINMKTK